MKRFSVVTTMALALVTFGTADRAQATTITGVGSDFNIAWNYACGGAPNCTGNAHFDVTAFSSTQLALTVTINNTQNAVGEFLVGLGWNMTPAATSIVNFTPGTFIDNARLNINFPSFNTVNVCTDNSGQGSCGSGNNGIPSPGTDTFSLTLGGNFGSSVELTGFALKYAGAFGSFEGAGQTTGVVTQTTGVVTQTTGISPEPTMLVLLGSGLVMASRRMRRSRAKL